MILVSSSAENREIQALNGLRGLAAILVVMCHIELPEIVRSMLPFIEYIKELGWFGVPIYFVLSGYLITWLALLEKKATGQLSLRFFFLRRILRLWPIYFLTCGLGLWAWSFPSLDLISSSPEWFIPLITFTTNIAITLQMQHFGVLGAYWTLALEEQFYIFSGLSLKHFSSSKLIILYLVVFSACIMWRIYPLPYSCFLHYRIQLPISLASILLGCLLALIAPKIEIYLEQLQKTLSFIAIIGVCLLAYFEWPFPTTAAGSCLLMTGADFLALILVILAIGKSGAIHSFFNFRPLVYLGKISLCMYAVNLPVIYFYNQYKNIFSFVMPEPSIHPIYSFCFDIIMIYFIIIMISLAWQIIDLPITQIRKRYRPSSDYQQVRHNAYIAPPQIRLPERSEGTQMVQIQA